MPRRRPAGHVLNSGGRTVRSMVFRGSGSRGLPKRPVSSRPGRGRIRRTRDGPVRRPVPGRARPRRHRRARPPRTGPHRIRGRRLRRAWATVLSRDDPMAPRRQADDPQARGRLAIIRQAHPPPAGRKHSHLRPAERRLARGLPATSPRAGNRREHGRTVGIRPPVTNRREPGRPAAQAQAHRPPADNKPARGQTATQAQGCRPPADNRLARGPLTGGRRAFRRSVGRRRVDGRPVVRAMTRIP